MSHSTHDEEEENGQDYGGPSGDNEMSVRYNKKDGIEKDGYICFPVDAPVAIDNDEPADDKIPEAEAGILSTCPDDPRFQQTNKTKWCYRMYVDYHSCRNLLGSSANQCNYFYRCYTSLCPHSWVEKWDDQREQENFPCDPTKGCPNLNSKCEDHKTCP